MPLHFFFFTLLQKKKVASPKNQTNKQLPPTMSWICVTAKRQKGKETSHHFISPFSTTKKKKFTSLNRIGSWHTPKTQPQKRKKGLSSHCFNSIQKHLNRQAKQVSTWQSTQQLRAGRSSLGHLMKPEKENPVGKPKPNTPNFPQVLALKWCLERGPQTLAWAPRL